MQKQGRDVSETLISPQRRGNCPNCSNPACFGAPSCFSVNTSTLHGLGDGRDPRTEGALMSSQESYTYHVFCSNDNSGPPDHVARTPPISDKSTPCARPALTLRSCRVGTPQSDIGTERKLRPLRCKSRATASTPGGRHPRAQTSVLQPLRGGGPAAPSPSHPNAVAPSISTPTLHLPPSCLQSAASRSRAGGLLCRGCGCRLRGLPPQRPARRGDGPARMLASTIEREAVWSRY